MIIEWLFERKNPHPVGTIEGGHPAPSRGRPLVLVIKGIAGAALIAWGGFLALDTDRPFAMLAVGALYLVVAYFVHLRPDHSNLGVAGGLIDHPFRLSDDENRLLLGLQVVLYPGRFATTGVRDLLSHLSRVTSKP